MTTTTEDRGHTDEILTEAAYQRFIDRKEAIICATCLHYPCQLWDSTRNGIADPWKSSCAIWHSKAKEVTNAKQH